MLQMIPIKPGWKTTQFYVTCVTTLAGLLVGSGILTPSGNTAVNQVAGWIVAGLSSTAYAILRTWIYGKTGISLPEQTTQEAAKQ